MDSEYDTEIQLVTGELTEKWSKETQELNQKESSLGLALHKMSQQVTIMLTTLELTQMTGEVLPEDIEILLKAATELRDRIKQLRAENTSNKTVLCVEHPAS
jgi:hypothetical protein